MIRWEEYGIEIVGTARNGQQAMDMIDALHPEIVITDIKMPRKSGLDVAEECSRKYGHIPLFIILTSYEEFDFVRRALMFQAVDYMVKLEVSPESLGAAVSKALSMLRELHRMEDTKHTAPLPGTMGIEHTQRLQDAFFHDLYHQRIKSTEEFRQRRDQLGMRLNTPVMTVVAATIAVPTQKDEVVDGTTGSDVAIGSLSLYQSALWMLREMLESLYPCYVTAPSSEHGYCTILFCLENSDPSSFRKQYEAGLLKTIGILHDYFNVSIRMAAGKPVNDPLNLHESYVSACDALTETSCASARENPLRFFEKSLQRQNYQSHLVSKVEKYIRENLDKRLSLSEVAAKFNVSPNYLSQLFTRYGGMNFLEYVTAAKISEAKTMLLKGEGVIYEIADKLGYEDAFYFSKVFKKVEGISPREFLHRYKVAQVQTPPPQEEGMP
jgi:two-component system response regulator YesN